MRYAIMQGRLSPPQGDALQFFPKDWRAEFETAQKLGFEAIEWVFHSFNDGNPILTAPGRSEILSLESTHNVYVESICADIFLAEHLTKWDTPATAVLANLMDVAWTFGIKIINIPFVEEHAPKNEEEKRAAIENIRQAVKYSRGDVDLALEMDLPAGEAIEFLEAVGSSRVGVCYDTGNAMTMGFDAGADIRMLGKQIKELHMKDRIKHTRNSVILGTGSVDFPDVFRAVEEVGFADLCVLQAWRTTDYLGDAKNQFAFIQAGFEHR